MEIRASFSRALFVYFRVKYFFQRVHLSAVLGTHVEDGMLCSLEAVVPVSAIPAPFGDQEPLRTHISIMKPSYTLQVIGDIIWVLDLKRCPKGFPGKAWALLHNVELGPVNSILSLAFLV